MKILIVGAFPGSLILFRKPLIEALVAKNVRVFAAANGHDPATEAALRARGVSYHPIRIARTGLNPIADAKTLRDLIRVMRFVKPDAVLSYTIKPVIYGSLAARWCGIRNVFSLIEGLGRPFMPWESFSHAASSLIARGLYRLVLPHSTRIFLLNPDDMRQLIREKYFPPEKAVLLNGIGIDLKYYSQEQLPEPSRIRFLMVARLLRDKGVREFVAAAKVVRARHQHVEFVLAGDRDDNPSSIEQAELDAWRREGAVNYLGQVDDVRPLYRDCHVFVLPTFYREGVPRTLLEALATGRALITTDSPGCRETVKHGYNGSLVQVKDVNALAGAMERFISDPLLIVTMGKRSRELAEEKFDVHAVNAVMLRAMGVGL